MSEERKENWLLNHGCWLLPLAAVVVSGLILLVPVYWISPSYAGRIEYAQKQRKIFTYTIDTPKGEIVVTEIKSGTEFNRILQMPNGRVIAEGGWINRWGEEQIRLMGADKND